MREFVPAWKRRKIDEREAAKTAPPVGALTQPIVAAAAVAWALNADTPAERKDRLCTAYEREQITGAMLAELIAMHGLKEA